MSDYTKLPHDIADCMRRAGAPLSEDQKLLLAGYMAPVQQRLADCEARVAELEKAGRMLSFSEWKKRLEREDVRECGHVVYRSPAEKSLLYAKYRQSCEQNLDSLLLRKQAGQAGGGHAVTVE